MFNICLSLFLSDVYSSSSPFVINFVVLPSSSFSPLSGSYCHMLCEAFLGSLFLFDVYSFSFPFIITFVVLPSSNFSLLSSSFCHVLCEAFLGPFFSTLLPKELGYFCLFVSKIAYYKLNHTYNYMYDI